jgi:hypothetical protein
MPRRRALAVVGGAIAALLVPGRAGAGSPRAAFHGPMAGPTKCPPPGVPCQNDPYYCRPPGNVCCDGNPGNSCAKQSDCCGGGRCCCNSKRGEFCCDNSPGFCKCCPKGWVCANKQCTGSCPAGTTKCGRFCCPRGQQCKNGKCCTQCSGPRSQCCDPATENCCVDKKTCCKKSSEYCCSVGATTATLGAVKDTCCSKPGACLKETISTGGTTRDSKFVCCPPERQVLADGQPQFCCAENQVAVTRGNALILRQSGGNPFCCDNSQVCGTEGDHVKCCNHYDSPTFADLNETCCGGNTCVRLQHDALNCGRCGHRCPAGQECSQGRCVPA